MRYFIQFSYDGTQYYGYQRQPKHISVQEKLESVLSRLLRKEIKTIGAGRTDTGVHAAEMYAHFDWEEELPDQLVRKLNSLLPSDISIKAIFRVKDSAHARFDATERIYKYRISTLKNPFKQQFHAQFLFYQFDVDKMNKAAKVLFEYKDFTSFSKLHSDNKTNDCYIYQAEWKQYEDELVFTIAANRFLRNMVRAIAGTLMDVGRGKIDEKEFRNIIEKKDRKFASTSAPAKGLTLVKVNYPQDIYYET
ncbi:tRNA pseudouridine(38-40) synthase TruA [Apibacter sp. ESL0404]|uniref:tRNA pseudouridine(38-40) synthase TruA n=1 Tax=Apibacter sp. ESL0404 TaxID=2704651 RepID=UPI001C6A4EC0|nr:tRNA pseudouridine(38-40) synthase TruA [Apibacter sp. ESL0404]QYN51744.1 tRNA pseudouridine(38-40) synthase TruA [Apibacter sp. ESL0404]